MARSDHTAFFRTRDGRRLAAAIRYRCSCDAYQETANPVLAGQADARRLCYGKPFDAPIWAFGCLSTATEWTIIKTAPLELLCEYPRRYLRPRLALISMLLGCPAIQVNTYQEASLYTVEGDSLGNSCITGATLDEVRVELPDGLIISHAANQPGARIGLSASRRSPFILSAQYNSLFQKDNDRGLDDAAYFGEALTGVPYDYWSNAIQFDYLAQGRPLPQRGTQKWYFCRGQDT